MKWLLVYPAAIMMVIAVLAVSGGSDKASATEVFGRSAGPGVDAFWGFPEADGGFSGVGVFAGTETVRARSKPQTAEVVDVFIFREFPDHTVREIAGRAELEPGDLDLPESLESGTLEATIPAHDCLFLEPSTPGEPPTPAECTETTISVDLTWTAVGGLGTQHGSFHDRFGNGCAAHGSFSFRGSFAEVSGTVTSGGTDYTRGQTTQEGRLIERSRDHFVGIGGDCFLPPPEPEA